MELILKEGKIVFAYNSESIAGTCSDYIYQYQDGYYLVFEGCNPEGPYETIVDALSSYEIGMINNATESIETVLSAEELLPFLFPHFYEYGLPYKFTINGEIWQVNKDQTITRAEATENMTTDENTKEEVIEHGTPVYRLYWDSGGPGAGADNEWVYAYQGSFYVSLSYEAELFGPYETLEEAAKFAELFSVNESTEEIETIVAAEDLVKRLEYQGDRDHTFIINGSKWRVSAEGVFSPEE